MTFPKRALLVSTVLTIEVGAVCVASLSSAQPVGPRMVPAAAPPGYELAWADEFDGTTVDPASWYRRSGRKDDCLSEPDNATLNGAGELVIELARDGAGALTCGGVVSTRTFGHGYYETEANLPAAPGWHTSFWLAGLDLQRKDTPTYTGPANHINEIDAFEVDSATPSDIDQVAHWYVPHHVGRAAGVYTGVDTSLDEYHVFGVEWSPNELTYYVDGVETFTIPYEGPHGLQNVWLTSLGTEPDATSDVAKYKYFRYYRSVDDGVEITPASVVVDNADSGFTASSGWSATDEAYGFQDTTTLKSDSASATAGWTPTLPSSGGYEVYVWNPSFYASSNSNARYTITHAGGTSAVSVNQLAAGQRWVSLGTYSMTPGASHGVRIAAAGTGSLRADSALFTPVGTAPPDDTTAPAAPTGVAAQVVTAPVTGDPRATVTWNAVTAADTVGYHVYLGGRKVTWNAVDRRSFTLDGLRAGTTYTLTVTAVDHSGNESAQSSAASAAVAADTSAPATPRGLSVEIADAELILRWQRNTEVDLAGYDIYADGRKLNTVGPFGGGSDPVETQRGYVVTGLANGRPHEVEVRARDVYSNVSSGISATATPIDMPIVEDDGVAGTPYWETPDGDSWLQSSVPGWKNSASRASSHPDATAQWHPTFAAAGTYEVYAWVPNHPNGTTDALYAIVHAAGTSQRHVSQTNGGNGWMPLGSYEFSAGTSGYVLVSNAANVAGDYLRTDAMKFVPVP